MSWYARIRPFLYHRTRSGELDGELDLALGHLARDERKFDLAEIYYQRELKWARVMARCRVVEGAFFDPPRRRAVPAADF